MKRRLERLWQLAREVADHDAPGAASAMAFHAFFSLMPLVALIGWASGKLVEARPPGLDAVLRFTPRYVANIADSELTRLSATGDAVLAPLSAIGFLWLSSGGVDEAMKWFERLFGAPPRRWYLRRAVALGFVIAAIVTVAASAAVALMATAAGDVATRAAALLVPLMSLWVLVGGFFRVATARREGVQRRGFRGAAVTVAAWIVVSLMFSLYVREIANYSQFYGGLAAVAVLLVWLWLMALSLLLGGEVNARLEGARGGA